MLLPRRLQQRFTLAIPLAHPPVPSVPAKPARACTTCKARPYLDCDAVRRDEGCAPALMAVEGIRCIEFHNPGLVHGDEAGIEEDGDGVDGDSRPAALKGLFAS